MGLSSPDIYQLSDLEWDAIAEDFYVRAAAGASSGNSVVFDDVLNLLSWSKLAARTFANHDVTLVRVYCPLNLLKSREMKRQYADTVAVQAQFQTVHRYKRYDVAVDTSRMTLEQCADKIERYGTAMRKNSISIAEKFLGEKAFLLS